MSKINEIENAIKQLEGGRYQSLMDQYLYRKFKYDNIQSLGSQEGTDKTTKGIPDSYIKTEVGSYILIMYGTHTNSVSGNQTFKKIKSDIECCLKQFNKENIYEIICCHTSSNLTIEQDKEIHKLFKNVTLIGINTLANDLYYKYPQLAEEFLSVKIDTGQILYPDDFIKNNNNSVYETPLDVELIGRDKEKAEVIELLDSNDVVIIEGPSGIGKTKFSFEVCNDFSIKTGYDFRVIKNKNLSIYNDLQTYFLEDNNYIILIDDANQLTDIEFVLNMVKNNTSSKTIKLVLTVRDYAKNDTVSKVMDIIRPCEYKLSILEESVIKNIVETNLSIKNEYYLEQISKIAKGNVRLAFMAGINSKKEGQFKNIQNASDIFELYFKYIIKDLSTKELVLMALFAFIEAFEIDNEYSNIYSLARISNIDDECIKETCSKFHELEIVDIFENLAVKFSDQNLSDYIIYYIFFKEKLFPLDALIVEIFPSMQEKVIYHISTTLRLFRSDESIDFLENNIRSIWNNNNFNSDTKYKFASSFHELIENEVLLFLSEEIDLLDSHQIEILSYNLKNNSSFSNIEILNILSSYKNSDIFDDALDLFIKYINCDNSKLDAIKNALISGFGVNTSSHLTEYKREFEILNALFDKYMINPNDNTAILCMLYASHCLEYSFETTKSSYHSQNYSFIRYSILNCNGIKKLHSKAFEVLHSFYSSKKYYNYSYKLLINYNPFVNGISKNDSNLKSIQEYDSKKFECYFSADISYSNISDCYLVNHFYDKFKVENIAISDFYSIWNNNKNYVLIKKLQTSYFDKDKGVRESKDKKLLKELIQSFSLMSKVEMKKLLIDSTKIKFTNEWMFYERLSIISQHLDKKNFLEFTKLLIEFTPKNYRVDCIVARMIENIGYINSYKLINSYNTVERNIWFNSLINQVEETNINDAYCENILNGLKQNVYLYFLSFETLYRIKQKRSKFLSQYISVLSQIDLSKCKNIISTFIYRAIAYLNNDIDSFIDFFDNNDQIKCLYLLAIKEKDYFDYDGKIFTLLMEKDETIVTDIIDIYINNNFSYHDQLIAFEKIWELKNYKEIVEFSVNYILTSDKYSFIIEDCFEQLFKNKEKIIDKQFNFMKELLSTYSNNLKTIGYLLKATESWPKEYRFNITKYICSINNSIDIFKKCPIAPLPHIMSGSEVPYIENRIKEYDEILLELKGIDFIQHRVICNDYISELQKYKQKVLKREYIYNY